MITAEGNLDYAATRVQAQHGRLPTESDWQSLEASQDLAHYVDAARAGVWSNWVNSFDVHQNLHVMERSLRTQWQRHVERVAAWHPREWQAWLRWLGWLPSLPLLVPLVQRQAPPAWLLSDPTVGPAARTAAASHGAAVPGARGHAVDLPLDVAGGLPVDLAVGLAVHRAGTRDNALDKGGAPHAIASQWRTRWDALAPSTDDEERAHLAQLRRAIDQHAAALPTTSSTPALRRQLAQRLNTLYRLSSGTGVGTACHLGRLALELERLRGGIASRSLLGQRASTAGL